MEPRSAVMSGVRSHANTASGADARRHRQWGRRWSSSGSRSFVLTHADAAIGAFGEIPYVATE
eukprot:8630819-Pyramimonas_sp.AAC.1